MPLFLISILVFARHIINILVDKDGSYVLTFVDKHVYFFMSLMLLSYTIITFVNTYKKDLINSFTLEESMYSGMSKNDEKTQTDAFSKVINGTWFVISVIIVLDHFGVPASSILAFGGMGSIVIGFAARDILSDVISGLLLYFDNQFKIGEWIKIDTPNIEGTVEQIGWRVSKIQTFDNRPIYVPNKFLGTAIIQNVSRRDSMRFKEYLTLEMSSIGMISIICKEIRSEILLNHDGIDTSKPIVVNLTSFEGEVANIYISAHTKSADISGFYAIKQDIWIKVYHVLVNHGVLVKAPILYSR
ncbi:mechanosensitive ion channel family protein [Vibrio crassostreae]|uniref:mechanosensitive ion channel family protein n=1 Tax=Vibrio crassostreae TaxID=246167 RepID=UPI001B313A0D|nr:mechanosensitive ion channel family protein [Vibrio crassostreae]